MQKYEHIPRCAVLMAAYNGISWIDSQLESILLQANVSVTVFINVDLSNDGTFLHLKNNYGHCSNITLLPYGERYGGAAKNFFHLIRAIDFSSFDYVAFSDQDDLWLCNKLSFSIRNLDGFDVFSSNVIAFWPNGKLCLIDKAQPQVEYDFIFESAGPGCTYLMRADFLKDFQSFIVKNECEVNAIGLHDWLIYAFARSNNYSWHISHNPTMLYRQHGKNQVGANNSLPAAWKRLKLIKGKWYRNEIAKISSLLSLNDSSIVKYGLLKGYLGNLYLLINISKLRRRFRDRMVLSLILAFNLF